MQILVLSKSVEQVFQRVVSKTSTCATIKSQLYSCTIPLTTLPTQPEKYLNALSYSRPLLLFVFQLTGDRTESNRRGGFWETRAWSRVFLRISNNKLSALVWTLIFVCVCFLTLQLLQANQV